MPIIKFGYSIKIGDDFSAVNDTSKNNLSYWVASIGCQCLINTRLQSGRPQRHLTETAKTAIFWRFMGVGVYQGNWKL